MLTVRDFCRFVIFDAPNDANLHVYLKEMQKHKVPPHSVPMMYSKRHLPDIEQWHQRHPEAGSS